jgi:hypothetical protein
MFGVSASRDLALGMAQERHDEGLLRALTGRRVAAVSVERPTSLFRHRIELGCGAGRFSSRFSGCFTSAGPDIA